MQWLEKHPGWEPQDEEDDDESISSDDYDEDEQSKDLLQIFTREKFRQDIFSSHSYLLQINRWLSRVNRHKKYLKMRKFGALFTKLKRKMMSIRIILTPRLITG